MNEYKLIDDTRTLLNTAEVGMNQNDHKFYCIAMSALLDLLMVELVGGASNETQTRIDNYQPSF